SCRHDRSRPMSRQEWQRRLDALNAKAEAAGKEYWPGRDLKLRLRNRNRYLSFHPEFDLRDSDDRKGDFLVADRRQSRATCYLSNLTNALTTSSISISHFAALARAHRGEKDCRLSNRRD